MIGWAIMVQSGVVTGWRVIDSATMELLEGEYFLPEAEGPPPTPQQTPAQVEAATTADLEGRQRQANAQVMAIQGRIDTINDAIDLEEALPEEVAELPARTAQLKVWKKYRIDLGRVTGIPGWYQTPTWPVTPEPYTSEMSRENGAV